MKFISPKFIRLRHCDSASIVFYPQSYYLPHETQDDFFSHIGFPLHDMIIQCNIDYAIFGVNKQKNTNRELKPKTTSTDVYIDIEHNSLK